MPREIIAGSPRPFWATSWNNCTMPMTVPSNPSSGPSSAISDKVVNPRSMRPTTCRASACMASTFSVFGSEAWAKTARISWPSTVVSDSLNNRRASICSRVCSCLSTAATNAGEMMLPRRSAHVRSKMMATPAIEQTSSGHMAIPPRKNHSGMRKSSLSIVEGETYLARFLPNQRAQFIGQRIERTGFYDGFLAKQRQNLSRCIVRNLPVLHLSVIEKLKMNRNRASAFVHPETVDQGVPAALHGFNELLIVCAEWTFRNVERGYPAARDPRNRQVRLPRHQLTAWYAGLRDDSAATQPPRA